MKYILHFKDGHDEVVEGKDHRDGHEMYFDSLPGVESWEEWYPDWQGNERGDAMPKESEA
jgi:hypothetical protein